MNFLVRNNPLLGRPLQAGATLGVLALLVAGSAQAVEVSLLDDQVSGSLDTTLSYGSVWRVSGRDDVSDINTDDGNRNFDTGQVSEVFKVTSELLLNYQNYGAFVRGTAAYDTQIKDSTTITTAPPAVWSGPVRPFPMTTSSPRTPAMRPAMRKSLMPMCSVTGMCSTVR